MCFGICHTLPSQALRACNTSRGAAAKKRLSLDEDNGDDCLSDFPLATNVRYSKDLLRPPTLNIVQASVVHIMSWIYKVNRYKGIPVIRSTFLWSHLLVIMVKAFPIIRTIFCGQTLYPGRTVCTAASEPQTSSSLLGASRGVATPRNSSQSSNLGRDRDDNIPTSKRGVPFLQRKWPSRHQRHGNFIFAERVAATIYRALQNTAQQASTDGYGRPKTAAAK